MIRLITAVRCLLLLGLLGCAGAASLPAAAADSSSSAKNKGRKVALLVGVRTYERSQHFPELKYTENDVEKLAVALKKNGFTDVRLLTTTRGEKDKKDAPTAENLRKA